MHPIASHRIKIWELIEIVSDLAELRVRSEVGRIGLGDANHRTVEYLVAVNNAATAQSVSVPTYSAGMTFDPIYGGAVNAATTGADSKLAMTAIESPLTML